MLRIFRKYYTPGLISLIVLPVLCYAHLHKYLHPKKEYALQLHMPSRNSPFFNFHNFPPKRIYQRIELSGKPTLDSISLSTSAGLIRNMIIEKDTINGICVYLNKNMNYQSFITLLDICEFEKANVFGMVDDNFWIAPVANSSKPADILIIRDPYIRL